MRQTLLEITLVGFRKCYPVLNLADITNLPDVLKTKEMRQAMETLRDFSENQKNYLLYQSRLDAQLERNTWQKMVREATAELASERKEKKRAIKAQEKERLEKELYLKILKEKGIDIDNILLSHEDKILEFSKKNWLSDNFLGCNLSAVNR